jgi:hypothetical protein
MKINYQLLTKQRDINPLLHLWRGQLVKIWYYQVTHCVLEIRIISEKNSNNHLKILCGDVEHYHGPMSWFDCALEVESINGRFILRDKKANFELLSGAIGAEEISSF